MTQPLLPQLGHFDGVGGGEKKRGPGRPKGSGNKRSPDLARYLAAMGGTPGQQIAQLAMCTAADVARAVKDAAALGIEGAGLSKLELAHVVKAERLRKALGGITRAEAYALGHKMRVELLPYAHQKQAAAKDPGEGGPAAVAYLVPEGEAHQAALPAFDDDDEALEILEVSEAGGREVGNGQSDDA